MTKEYIPGERYVSKVTGQEVKQIKSTVSGGSWGRTQYVHIKYSDVPEPQSTADLKEDGGKYMGTYTDFEPQASDDPHRYTWSKIKGETLITHISKKGFVRNGAGSITLTASISDEKEDVTARYLTQQFSWIRESGRAEEDAAWNKAHEGVGRQITITHQDMHGGAIIDCILTE